MKEYEVQIDFSVSVETERTETFEHRVNTAIANIGEKAMDYDEKEIQPWEHLYFLVEDYAWKKKLPNTAIALHLLRALLVTDLRGSIVYKRSESVRIPYFRRALSSTRMLIDLHAPLSRREEDIALAASLCYVLMKILDFNDPRKELTDRYNLDPEVCEILLLVYKGRSMTEEETREFYQRIQKNKLAVLVKLADRGDRVTQLYDMSLWKARDYIRETRSYFFPMCIYAKEHYFELFPVITILMEKMRSLVDVADILSSRYQERELALTSEILNLREENARIRGVIARLREEQ